MFYGKEYLVIDHFVRAGVRFLRCIDEQNPENNVITIPAAITDYYSYRIEPGDSLEKTYFTIQDITEVDNILGYALKR
jgi:hypothetical protein